MIVYTIILIIAGAFIAALAGLAYTLIAENSRFRRTANIALTGKEAEIDKLIQEINRLQQENIYLKARDADLSEALEATRRIYNDLLAKHRELEARNTALLQTIEAKPTLPKRTVRKNSTAGEQQP